MDGSKQRVQRRTGDPVTDLALDAITDKKQLIVFVNTKRSAEACAERIANAVNKNLPLATRHGLSDDARTVLSSPTSQCHRLADSVAHQSAFHHSGLHSEQRSIVEDGFKSQKIRAVCATPTLAAGLDMPAYRVIIRDLQRYSGGWGMQPIPVLEYEQMSGRAGRPSYDDQGQAITLAGEANEIADIRDDYIDADPEPIQSKLAARPVLRTYTLSLVATGYIGERDELDDFMQDTFYAHQYGDDEELTSILGSVIDKLKRWSMIDDQGQTDGFVSAKELADTDGLEATELGQRVSELYLDPYTANNLVERLKAADDPTAFALLHAVANTLEMRPLIRVKKNDKRDVEAALLRHEDDLLCDPPGSFEDDYKEFLNGIKTTMVLHDWVNEVDESDLSDRYGVTPGELQAKRSLADWLLYSCDELCDVLGERDLASTVRRIRRRVNLGVKPALLNLTRFDGVGRVRARTLYDAGIADSGDVKQASYEQLKDLMGPKTAKSVKEQVGQDVKDDISDDVDHGNLLDYSN